MIIDCHAHLEPRMLDLDAMVARLDRAGVDRVVLIPTMNDPLPEPPERLLAVARALMQSRLTRPLAELVHRSTLTPEGDLRLQGKRYQIYARPDNASVAAAIRKRPDRFWGWIFLNPRGNPTVLDELERWRAEPGMIGVKLHPHWHDYRIEIALPLLRRCQELRLPVLVHLGFGKRGDFRTLARELPDLLLICAHGGVPAFGDLWDFARREKNVFVDLSSPYLDEPLARRAVARLGPERCLYGTDAPYGFHDADHSYDYRHILGWVERLPLPAADVERILSTNFQAILARSRPAA